MYGDEEVESGETAEDVPLPRQTSVSDFAPGPSFSNPPAAMQSDRAGQATEKLLRSVIPGRSGVRWSRQCAPFHRSARVCGGNPPGAKAIPTPVQDDSDVQDTLLKKSPAVPGGLGLRCTRQVP